jgi:hypothetical protein
MKLVRKPHGRVVEVVAALEEDVLVADAAVMAAVDAAEIAEVVAAAAAVAGNVPTVYSIC